MKDEATRSLKREQWHDLARKLDWGFSYVDAKDVFPEAMSGTPWLSHQDWADWDEPYRTSYTEYVSSQVAKEASVNAVREAIGRPEDFARLERPWLSALKLHSATLPLAEFAAAIGNLRAARFGRDSAWRTTAAFGAMDEFRHTQIPLLLMHGLLPWDPQFDWTHKFFHSENWVAVAGRHLADELLLCANPIEFAVGTNFVFETGFTNLQFIGLSSLARNTGDRMFENMVNSIQTDEARHAQIGKPVLATLVKHDPEYAQYLVDKWFWRSWHFFAVVTGFAMDYLTPVRDRTASFKEFMQEWVLGQFQASLEEMGLKRPWYWDTFLASLDNYHHMVYASAYTYRATVWFDMVVPGPEERAWLREKYPDSWPEFEPIWDRISERWKEVGPEVEWHTHGATPVGFCALCQMVLCEGAPGNNHARVIRRGTDAHIFCSEPCQWLFEKEPDRYEGHKDVVKRILAGEAPANLLQLLRHFGLSPGDWGRDAHRGHYPWAKREAG